MDVQNDRHHVLRIQGLDRSRFAIHHISLRRVDGLMGPVTRTLFVFPIHRLSVHKDWDQRLLTITNAPMHMMAATITTAPMMRVMSDSDSSSTGSSIDELSPIM